MAVLGDFNGFIQLTPGSNTSEKPNKNTDVDKVHLKGDCINGLILDGVFKPILYSDALYKQPGHRI